MGESDLEMYDPGMNVYSGRFHALPAYLQVRSVFKLFASALDATDKRRDELLHEYYQQRDLLDLEIRGQDGRPVPFEWMNIVDVSDDLDELGIELHPRESMR